MPTPLGWGITAVSILLYGAGALLGYPEPAVLAVTGLVAVLVAVLWTLPRPRLAVTREIAPLKVARGDPAVGVLHLTNKGRGIRAGLVAHDAAGAEAVAVEIPRLKPGGARRITYRLPTGRRGDIPVGPLRLVRTDPLGLARRVREYGEPRTLLVRPRTTTLPLLPSGRAHHLEGPTTDRAPAGTVTFHTLREYVVGDDLRHVHWKSSARTGTLMVRQLVDASLPSTTIVIEARPESWPTPEGFELAVDAAASVALGACQANFPVRVRTGTVLVHEGRGGASETDAVMDTLARLTTGPAPESAVDAVRRVPAGGSLVVIVPAGTDLTRLPAIRSRFDRVVPLAIGPTPTAAPAGISVLEIPDLETLPAAWTREATR
jgi:uncharacterized protein (DUF58 family)